MYSNDIGIYIRVYNMRLPCCPMPHHRASKLVFRLSIAHYLLSVTKITSLTFSLSPGRSRWRLRVHARARAHAYRAFSWHACIWGSIVSTILSTLLITRSRTGSAHMIRFFSLPRGNIKSDHTVQNLLADTETEHRAKRQFTDETWNLRETTFVNTTFGRICVGRKFVSSPCSRSAQIFFVKYASNS